MSPSPAAPLQNRACSSPAHGSPPGSRSASFRRATGVGRWPQLSVVDLAGSPKGAGEWPRRASPQPCRSRTHTRLEALRSGEVVLSSPSTLPYGLLRLPLHAPPLHIAAYRLRCYRALQVGSSQPSMPVPRRISPVPWWAVRSFRSLYAGGLSVLLQAPSTVHGLRRSTPGSASAC